MRSLNDRCNIFSFLLASKVERREIGFFLAHKETDVCNWPVQPLANNKRMKEKGGRRGERKGVGPQHPTRLIHWRSASWAIIRRHASSVFDDPDRVECQRWPFRLLLNYSTRLFSIFNVTQIRERDQLLADNLKRDGEKRKDERKRKEKMSSPIRWEGSDSCDVLGGHLWRVGWWSQRPAMRYNPRRQTCDRICRSTRASEEIGWLRDNSQHDGPSRSKDCCYCPAWSSDTVLGAEVNLRFIRQLKS